MTREDAVRNLLSNGELHLAEAARLLGWPYHRTRREALARGINARAARRAFVERLMDEAEEIERELTAAEANGKRPADTLAEVMAQRG